uniref:AlNc14C282G10124 protein n=1 Tax=Albugo laibachii Nc14 TaxID=890382 RepID=F0WUX7_9STRA|nr:AlNc14C282G10124 [Albugo laibachii Nc14]|eukprot:CCA25213.1 AlNc14C282G10124 [Albugo laibachii Nc14]
MKAEHSRKPAAIVAGIQQKLSKDRLHLGESVDYAFLHISDIVGRVPNLHSSRTQSLHTYPVDQVDDFDSSPVEDEIFFSMRDDNGDLPTPHYRKPDYGTSCLWVEHKVDYEEVCLACMEKLTTQAATRLTAIDLLVSSEKHINRITMSNCIVSNDTMNMCSKITLIPYYICDYYTRQQNPFGVDLNLRLTGTIEAMLHQSSHIQESSNHLHKVTLVSVGNPTLDCFQCLVLKLDVLIISTIATVLERYVYVLHTKEKDIYEACKTPGHCEGAPAEFSGPVCESLVNKVYNLQTSMVDIPVPTPLRKITRPLRDTAYLIYESANWKSSTCLGTSTIYADRKDCHHCLAGGSFGIAVLVNHNTIPNDYQNQNGRSDQLVLLMSKEISHFSLACSLLCGSIKARADSDCKFPFRHNFESSYIADEMYFRIKENDINSLQNIQPSIIDHHSSCLWVQHDPDNHENYEFCLKKQTKRDASRLTTVDLLISRAEVVNKVSISECITSTGKDQNMCAKVIFIRNYICNQYTLPRTRKTATKDHIPQSQSPEHISTALTLPSLDLHRIDLNQESITREDEVILATFSTDNPSNCLNCLTSRKDILLISKKNWQVWIVRTTNHAVCFEDCGLIKN